VYGSAHPLRDPDGQRAARSASPQRDLPEILQVDPLRIRTIDPQVPPDLEAIALKALSKDPGERYANGDEFADDLGRYLAGLPVKA
jgi:serine/threonine-protein kinase